MKQRSRKVFEEDHRCYFSKRSSFLEILIPRNNFCSKLWRKLREMCLISETNCRKCFQQKSMSSYNYEKEYHLAQHYYMVHPYSEVRFFWEIAVLCEILVTIFARTFYISFPPDVLCEEQFLIFSLCLDLLEMADIIFRFFTGYVEKGSNRIILDMRKVFNKNMSQHFFIIDLCVAFPVDFLLRHSSVSCPHSFLRYFIFLKLTRMRIFHQYSAHFAKVNGWSDAGYKGIMTAIWVLVLSHWMTCLYFLIIATSKGHDWMEDISSGSEKYLAKYFITFYMVFSMLIAQNGLLSSVELNERRDWIFCSVSLIVAYLVSIATVAFFIHLFGFLKTSRIKYDEMIQAVRTYMFHKDLPKSLQKKILIFYEFRFQGRLYREHDILKTISEPLRNEITNFLCSKLLTGHGSIFSKLPADVVTQLCAVMKLKIYLSNDVVAVAGDIGTRVYFISCGSVALYTSSGMEMDHLQEGMHFGQVAFAIPDNRYLATYVALEPCEMYTLHFKAFSQVMESYPELKNSVIRMSIKKKEAMIRIFEEQRDLKMYYHIENEHSFKGLYT